MMNEHDCDLDLELKTTWLGKSLSYYPTVTSTSDVCRDLAEKGEAAGAVVVAGSQSNGRSRGGRRWESPAGGLWFSLLLKVDGPPKEAAALTAVTAVGLCRGLLYYPGLGAKIKWPNDLMAEGKKFGGILAEMKVEADRAAYVVISVGIDVTSAALSEELRTTAIGMEEVYGDVVDNEELLCRLLLGLESAYDQFFAGQKRQLFNEWRDHALYVDEPVTVKTADGDIGGTLKGLTDDGFLLLDLGNGKGAKIISGSIVK